jgi:hypothetical protein
MLDDDLFLARSLILREVEAVEKGRFENDLQPLECGFFGYRLIYFVTKCSIIRSDTIR